jgi:hypothetical protein
MILQKNLILSFEFCFKVIKNQNSFHLIVVCSLKVMVFIITMFVVKVGNATLIFMFLLKGVYVLYNGSF